jgi:hypothetical protein
MLVVFGTKLCWLSLGARAKRKKAPTSSKTWNATRKKALRAFFLFVRELSPYAHKKRKGSKLFSWMRVMYFVFLLGQ